MNRSDAVQELVRDVAAPALSLREAHAENVSLRRSNLLHLENASDVGIFGRLTISAGAGLAALGAAGEALSFEPIERPSLWAVGIGIGGIAVGAAVTLYDKLTS